MTIHNLAANRRILSIGLIGALGLAACAQTGQGSRYGTLITDDCCVPPPQVVYVDRIRTVEVEKPVETIVEVEKIVEKIVEKPVYIEVPAPPVHYPEPPRPIPPVLPPRK